MASGEHWGLAFWRVAPRSTHEGGVPNPLDYSGYDAVKGLRVESLSVELSRKSINIVSTLIG